VKLLTESDVSFIRGSLVDTGVSRGNTISEQMRDVRDTMGLMVVQLRKFVRSLDNLMSAAEDIAKSSRDHQYDSAAIYNAMQKWHGPMKSSYATFAQSRSYFYEIAKGFGISTRVSRKRKPSKPLKSQTAKQLESGVDLILSRMSMTMPIMANEAAKLLHESEALLKAGEVTEDDARSLIKLFLEVRDDVSGNVFASVAGVLRRISAISAAGKHELAASADGNPKKSRMMEHMRSWKAVRSGE